MIPLILSFLPREKGPRTSGSASVTPVLTAFENVELPLLLTRLSGRERQEHVDLVLELVGLTRRRRHYPSELSGGEQQRVVIARAVMTESKKGNCDLE